MKRDKGFQDRDLFPEEGSREGKFLHIRKPHHGDGELWKLRVQCSGVRGGSEGKPERIHHRSDC